MKVIKGKHEIDSNEARDDFLDIKHTTNQHEQINIPIVKFKAIKQPSDVATPLPPLNFNHIGQQCPKTHPNKIKNIKASKFSE